MPSEKDALHSQVTGCGMRALLYLVIDFPGSLASLIRTTDLFCNAFIRRCGDKLGDIGMFQSEQGCEALCIFRW